MKTEIIYISGPMTGLPRLNRNEFLKAANYYKIFGHMVMNPHDIGHSVDAMNHSLGIKLTDYHEYLAHDLSFLVNCTKMVLLPGWQNSKGCAYEIAFATDCNIDIVEAYTERVMKFTHNLQIQEIVTLREASEP